ncbi:Protein T04C9.1 a [Aphelenchoides avenae]|nr:Protein T04C9.1 a [Aphelenchus avenae]
MGEFEQRRTEGIDQAERLYFEPLGDLRHRIKYILSTEKSRFEQSSKRFYAEQARNLAKSTELDRILSLEARKFHVAALRYVCQLQYVGERIKFKLIESVGAFLSALFSSLLYDNELHGKVKPFLDNLKADIRLVKARLSLTGSTTSRLKTACLSGEDKTLQNLRPNTDMIKEAYVYVPTKTAGLKLLPTAWRRHYAVYSKETRVLTLVPANTENLRVRKRT